MTVRGRRSLHRLGTLGVLCLMLAACLGRDYLSLSLDARASDHGWMVAIEPEEEFNVTLLADARYGYVAWQVADIDTSIIEVTSTGVDDFVRTQGDWDSSDVEKPQSFLSATTFSLRGKAIGESSLLLEIVVGGERIDKYELAVAVVEDACNVEGGLVHARCRPDHRSLPVALTEFEHGWLVMLEPQDELDIALLANAVHPDAAWQIAEVDSSIASIRSSSVSGFRPPGDWDTDPDKAPTFLPFSQFTLVADAIGQTPLVLEVVVDGEQVDVYELTLAVVEDACAAELGTTLPGRCD